MTSPGPGHTQAPGQVPAVAVVRPAMAADLADVTALDRECFAGAAWSDASWAEEFSRDNRRVLVAAAPSGVCSEIAGYVVLIVPENPRDAVDLTRVAVAPAHRRTGAGARLVDAALASVAGRVVLLEVAEGNESAIALYERAGFTEISRRRRYYGDEDAVIMRWGDADE